MTNEATNTSESQSWLNVLVRSREASLVLLIAALTALTTALNPRFLSPLSLKDLMLNVSIIALLVLGQTVIILMRQIDLSISSIVGITAFLSGTLFVNHPGIPSLLVVFLAVLAGLLLGAVNAGPVYRLLGKKDLGTPEFPPMETALIDGDVAWRQHSGGHTTGPNWPTFLTFASRYIKGPPLMK